MSIDWNALLTTFDGRKLLENENPDSKQATLSFVACQAINAQMPQDQGLAKGVKKDRAYLIKKLRRKDGPGELSAKDIEFIKERIELAYPAWTVGECWDLIEGTNGEAKTE